MRVKPTIEQRFWAKVDRSSECWFWRAAKDHFGHGNFRYPGGTLAHRYSYTLANGPIPNGMIVRHTCDEPGCVNPEHLTLGTMSDNAFDMHRRGRSYHARLTRGEPFEYRARTPGRTDLVPPTDEERFWALVDKSGDCWLWTGFVTDDHGRFRFRGRATWAHRVAWELTHGPIPNGFSVLHTCHVGSCVNPAHLYLGTQADNVRDRVRSGRQPSKAKGYDYWPTGERHPNARLTDAQAGELRASWAAGGVTKMALARRFAISHKTVRQIIAGEIYKANDM
jgi:hypothetical protein